MIFLKINLHFDTLDWISTYEKLNFLPIISDCLIFFSLEMPRRLVQNKVYYKLCSFVWNETCHKLLKVGTSKKYFPKAYIIDTTCFGKCLLLHVITGRRYSLYKFIVIQRFGETAMLLCSLKQMFWKRSAFYIRYLHNNITMLLIPKVHNKASTS